MLFHRRCWLLLPCALALPACGRPPCTSSDCGDEPPFAEPPETDPPGGPAPEFVLDRLRLTPPGVGLDGDLHDTQRPDDPIGCGHADSPGGIDSVTASLASTLSNATTLRLDLEGTVLDREIREGRLLVAVRLLDLDDARDDPSVSLLAYRAEDADEDPGNNLSGEGELVVRADALADDADPGSALVRFEGAQATDAVLQTRTISTGPLALMLPFETTVVAVTLWNVRFALTPEAEGIGFLSGGIPVDELERELLRLDPSLPPELLRTVLQAQADVDATPPGPTDRPCAADVYDCGIGQSCEAGRCVEPPNRCDAMSTSFGFSVAPVRIVGIAREGDG